MTGAWLVSATSDTLCMQSEISGPHSRSLESCAWLLGSTRVKKFPIHWIKFPISHVVFVIKIPKNHGTPFLLQDAYYEANWLMTNKPKMLPMGWNEAKISNIAYKAPRFRETTEKLLVWANNSCAKYSIEEQLERVIKNHCPQPNAVTLGSGGRNMLRKPQTMM